MPTCEPSTTNTCLGRLPNMSTAALDALRDVTGTGGRQSLAPQPSASQQAPSTQPSTGPQVMLAPGKLEMYAAVLAQLREDGLVDEARQLAARIGSSAATSAKSDYLYSAFEKQAALDRLSAAERLQKDWAPLRPRPLPPVGPQEELLDLRAFRPVGRLDDTEEDEMEEDLGDVVDRLAAVQRIAPPQFKTRYTAQHKQGVRCVAFSADGRLCASGSTDTSIKIMDTSKMRMFGVVTSGRDQAMDDLRPVIRTFYDHVGTVTSCAFHPRQPLLFTGSVDKTIKVFDLTRGGINKKAMTSITDVSPVNVVTPHPCGDFVLVGTQHPVVRLYDVNTQQCFSSYHQNVQHGGPITDIKAASDGSVFASTSVDGNVLLWDGVSNRVVNRLTGMHNTQPIFSVQWSRNNRYLLTSGGDHRARLWDVRTGRQLMVYADQPRSQSCASMLACFAHNEDFIMMASSACEEADVTLVDSRTGSMVVPTMGLHQGPVRCLANSPTDKTFLTGGDDFKVRYVEMSAEALADGGMEGVDDD